MAAEEERSVPPNVKDFQTYLERKREEELAKLAETAAPIQAAAVRKELLTGDSNWDSYLMKLQGHVEAFQKEMDAVKLDVFKAMPIDQNYALKYVYWKITGFLEAMEIAMKLPRQIVAEAQVRAKELAAKPSNS